MRVAPNRGSENIILKKKWLPWLSNDIITKNNFINNGYNYLKISQNVANRYLLIAKKLLYLFRSY